LGGYSVRFRWGRASEWFTTENTESTETWGVIHHVLTERIIGAAISVHRALGPGLLESTYEACLVHELACRGLRYERQKPMPVVYRSTTVHSGYRIDLLVEDAVIVELKAVERLESIHQAQILTYLKLSDLRVGLLINFNVQRLTEGLRRFVL
jgi:GxxExxY protein